MSNEIQTIPVKVENQAESSPDNRQIVVGSKFDSFKNFETIFNTWKMENRHPFRVASSETLRMPDGSLNEKFKYRYIVYHCAHYGSPRMRGIGKRPNQNYMPCGCRAMLRLNYSWTENLLKITTLHVDHTGHDLSTIDPCPKKVKKSPPVDENFDVIAKNDVSKLNDVTAKNPTTSSNFPTIENRHLSDVTNRSLVLPTTTNLREIFYKSPTTTLLYEQYIKNNRAILSLAILEELRQSLVDLPIAALGDDAEFQRAMIQLKNLAIYYRSRR